MGLLDQVEDSTTEELPGEADVGTNSLLDAFAPPEEGLEIQGLEVGGVKLEGETISDALGNTWQVPGDNVSDLDDLYAGDVYKIPKSITDVFHVQMIRKDQLQEYLMRRFVPITLKELGLPADLLKTGHPLDSYHVVGDSIMVKIPHAINNRIQEAKTRETKQRLLDMEATPETIKHAGVDSGMMIEHRLGFTAADPAKRQGVYVNEQGKVVG